MNKRMIVSVAVLALAAVCTAMAQERPNFSGTWVLDNEKSDPIGFGGGRGPGGGGGGGPQQVTLVIAHEGDSLKITRKVVAGGQERAQDLSYTTDGADNSNPGGRDQTIVSKTVWQGHQLVAEWSQSRGEMTLQTKEVRSLSADGKVMTVETTISGTPRGDTTRKQIYNKQ